MIQGLNSHNLLTKKSSRKSSLNNLQTTEKAKRTTLKPSNINLALVSKHIRKKWWNLLTQV